MFFRQVDNNEIPIVTQTQDSDQQEEETEYLEAVLDCYFHVMQMFKKNAGFVKLFIDRSLADPALGPAYKHVQLIHFCKSAEQRNKVMELVVSQWKHFLKEDKAADHFHKTYCRSPYWNFNYAASGEVGVYPTNCPSESRNKVLKTDVQMNVALPRMLVETFPKLLEEDTLLRSSPCTIEVPTDCTQMCVSLTGFIKEEIDIRWLGETENSVANGIICNLGDSIGVPLDDARMSRIRSALMGDVSPFSGREYSSNTPIEVATRMVKETKSVCHVTKNDDGVFVGDCEDCF